LRLNYGKTGFSNGAALNQVKNDYDALVNYTQKAANPNKYTVNKQIADAARDTLGAKSPALTETGREMSRLIQLADNAVSQSNLGRGNLPLSIGNLPLTVAGAGTGGIGGAAAGYVTNAIINSKTGRRALTKGVGAAGERLTNKAAGQSVGRRVLGGAARGQAAEGLLGALTGGLQSDGNSMDANAMTIPATTNDNINMMDSPYADPANTAMTNEPSSPFAVENLQSNVQKILAGGGSMKDVQGYVSLVEAMQALDPSAAGKQKPLNATQLQQSNNAQSGLADLQNLAMEIEKDPGVLKKAAVPGGGLARSLTGTIGFDASKQNVVDVIARLRSGAAITPSEAQRYMGLLPGFADSRETAMAKLQRLNSLLQSFADPQAAQSEYAVAQ